MSRCLLCGLPATTRLCHACQQDLPYYQADAKTAICACCASTFSQSANSTVQVCGACLNQARYFQRTYAVFYYDYPINQLISLAKYGRDLAVLRQLAEMMSPMFAQMDALPDCIMPIPMHPWYLRWRGFNQSLELAKYLGKVHNIEVDYRSCVCHRYPKKQASLNNNQRAKNVRGIFKVKAKTLDYQHVLIIDDVMTTGATVNELSRVLSDAGVKKISVLCAARAGNVMK